MALTTKQVEHIAFLSRLELTDEEKERFTQQLSSILEYVEMLNQLDTENVEPLNHILPIYNVFREDEVRSNFSRDEMMINAPLVEKGQYKVPRIM
ncbi:MAG: Asp-tRNA(Asn)/Glu-tRNA(Gln) amidotransferase subunit GatC [Syntrophomonadaceae bacterium]|jgi:aspartyl-tRNA(Asn)/glutamyl-tRNA(Gln) amidotransferase subunit C